MAVSIPAPSAAGSISALSLAGLVHSGAGEPLKVGLVGCGGRGTGAARQALMADKSNVLWAVGDAFADRVTDAVGELQEGAIGDILAIQGNYITGELWLKPRQPSWTDMENQMRNWLYHTWLSGDLIAEQHIHSLDVMAWIKSDVYPTRAYSLGGRQKRTGGDYGFVYDHFATVYEWKDGTRGFSYCRQQNGCFRDVDEYVMGTQGTARVFQHAITGKTNWKHEGPQSDMYQNEHDEMFAAIRAGKRIDNSDYMINSTMMAVLGRMAAYTGKDVTWQEAWESQEQLVPDVITMDMAPPADMVAIPGITKFR